MRWRIRYQLLVPPLLLLVGVVGVSAWVADAAAERARQRIERRVREIAHNFETTPPPVDADKVLGWIKLYSGADFVVVRERGKPLSTFGDEPFTPPAGEVYSKAADLKL